MTFTDKETGITYEKQDDNSFVTKKTVTPEPYVQTETISVNELKSQKADLQAAIDTINAQLEIAAKVGIKVDAIADPVADQDSVAQITDVVSQ